MKLLKALVCVAATFLFATPAFGQERLRPVITWNPPASIDVRTGDATSVHNATASVPGTFLYYSDRVRVVGPSEHCAEFYPDDQETYEPLTWQNDGWVCVFVPVVFPGTDEPAALHEIAMPNDWPEAMAVDAVNNRLYLGWMARDPSVESHVIVVMDGANEQELWRIPVPAVFGLDPIWWTGWLTSVS